MERDNSASVCRVDFQAITVETRGGARLIDLDAAVRSAEYRESNQVWSEGYPGTQLDDAIEG
jgi:hypothetical protein